MAAAAGQDSDDWDAELVRRFHPEAMQASRGEASADAEGCGADNAADVERRLGSSEEAVAALCGGALQRVRVLLLVGLPGSGKSTLAAQLGDRDARWQVVCQDELGTRARCEDAMREGLLRDRRIVVDRTNLSAEQRSTWIDLALSGGISAQRTAVLWMDVAPQECIRRVRARRGHPTIRNGNAAAGIVARMRRGWVRPDKEAEGFGALLVVPGGASASPKADRGLRAYFSVAPARGSTEGRTAPAEGDAPCHATVAGERVVAGATAKRARCEARAAAELPAYCHPRPDAAPPRLRGLHPFTGEPAALAPALQPYVYYRDDDFVVIYDGYRKAAFHLLILAREGSLRAQTPSQLCPGDVGVLEKMSALAARLVLHLRAQAATPALSDVPGVGTFRIGFHGIPSLTPLHLHIISTDFRSPWMKKRHHYNSFSTDFLVGLDPTVAWLRGEAAGPYDDARALKALKQGPMACHRCGRGFSNSFADLYRHVKTCTGHESGK